MSRLATWVSRRSFRLKLIGAALLAELVVVALLSLVSLRSLDESLIAQIRVRVEQSAPLLNGALATPLAQRDYAAAQEVLRQSRVEDGIEYLVLYDHRDRVVGATGWDRSQPPPAADAAIDLDDRDGRHDVALRVSLSGQRLGTLHYGISLESARRAHASAVVQSAGVALVATALMLVLLLGLGAWLTRGLASLTEASRRLAEGDLSARAEAVGDDEISVVAQSFNQMAHSLAARLRELKTSEERLALVIHGTADGIWDWDLNSGQIYFSDRFRELLGYSDQAQFEREFSFAAHLHPDDRERVLRAQDEHLLRRVPFDQEYRLRCRDGSYRWFRGRAQALWDDNGWAYRYAGAMTDLTRQKEAEAAQRASEQRLHHAVRGSTDGIWDWDLANDRYYLSPRFKELLGYADDEMANTRASFLEVLHPEDRPRVDAAVQRHFDTREPYDVEYRLRNRDGSYRWYRGRAQAVWDAHGRVMRFSGASMDIMEQKRSEAAIQALLAEKQALLDNALVGIAMVKDGNITSCNRRFEELFGYGPQGLLGASTSALYPTPEDRVAADTRAHPALARGEHWSDELLVKRRDGSLFWCLVNGRALDPLQPAEASIWIFLDVTEQRSMREALLEEKEFSDAVINSLPGVFYVYDEEGTPLRWNNNFEQVTGYSSAEIRTLTALDFIFGPERERMARTLAQALKEGESTGEARILSRGGRTHPYVLTAIRVEIQGRRLIVGVGIDIADRKRAEAEIRSLNEKLERRVRERTAELTAANRELEAFSYSVSHDLTAPLRSIDGFSRMLEEDYGPVVDEQGKHFLERIRSGTQRMQRLIDDLLSLSRITRNEMKRERLDLTRLAAQLAADLKQSQPERQVEFVIEPGLFADGDPNLLAIALGNLVRNAWKFTSRHEHARIEVGSLRGAEELAFYVRDDGAGFDMRYATKLFSPFQRMHGVKDFEGNGIGLALVHRIILRHGGRIWAEAEVEKGATFYFTLG